METDLFNPKRAIGAAARAKEHMRSSIADPVQSCQQTLNSPLDEQR